MTSRPLIPADLSAHIHRYWQQDGEHWLATLGDEIEEALTRWELTPVSVFAGASTAFVARVLRADHTPAVLKISYPEIRGEATALLAYGDALAIRVYEHTENTALLEEVWPGKPLREIGTEDEVWQVTLAIMRDLWRVAPFEKITTLGEQCARYRAIDRETLRALSPEIAAELTDGIELLVDLANDASRNVLLHGDLHPGNILSSTRIPWLVTDPKPLYGDPAYDAVPLVCEGAPRRSPVPEGAKLMRRIMRVAEALEVSPWRVAAWGMARRADWSCLCHRADDPSGAGLALEEMCRFRAAMTELESEAV